MQNNSIYVSVYCCKFELLIWTDLIYYLSKILDLLVNSKNAEQKSTDFSFGN